MPLPDHRPRLTAFLLTLACVRGSPGVGDALADRGDRDAEVGRGASRPHRRELSEMPAASRRRRATTSSSIGALTRSSSSAGPTPRAKLIEIGAEPGASSAQRVRPRADDGTFVVADAPRGEPRIQIFLDIGLTVTAASRCRARAVPRITAGNLVLSGLAADRVHRRDRSSSASRSWRADRGVRRRRPAARAFGQLRQTGQETTPPSTSR